MLVWIDQDPEQRECIVFTIYHSNQVDVLKSLLVELIRLNPLENPFEAEQILVQSPGMSQWLKMELANEFGVAANLKFPLPATFIWQLFSNTLADVPERSAFNKEAMTWRLMKILPQHFDLPEFAPLKQYLQDDQDQTKCYQLAAKIADIFDGYLVYRPEWIAAWEAGQVVEELNGEHPWQPILWQALYDQTLTDDHSPYHRANLYEHFIDKLDIYLSDVTQLAKLPKRLFVFGITALPPRYMDALQALGQHIDVHLMFTNPCRYYWGDIRDRKYLAKLAARTRKQVHWEQDHSQLVGEVTILKGSIEQNEIPEYQQLHTKDAVGNSLLASMGKLGRDNLYLLSQLEANEVSAFVDIERQSLLQHIQADILELQEHQNDQKSLFTSDYKPVIEKDDVSLQVHVCHSPMREVEVLHDRLLAMFDADPDLKPRDVIVMVADINAYSHAIQAVFGNAPAERFIPFSISDRSVDQENPILQAFMRLLVLPRQRCQASEVLELLEVPAVMTRFDIDEQEFEQISLWIEQVGIRWGLDEQTAIDLSLPKQKQNTWLFGIERMLLGYAMPEEAGLFNDGHAVIAAFDEVQGMNAELAGKLAQFVHILQKYRNLLSKDYTFSQWQNHLIQLLDDCFKVELEGEVILSSIRHCLQQLHEQLDDAKINVDKTTFSPQILEQYLQDHLSNSRVSQRFLAGQVNFCTLMPMRSIPFKTVCLLGMNDGLYPRGLAPEGFDLINGRTKHGDRSRRDDDRYLFLEALLSAQQSLYISYVGRSILDNSDKEPSVLVAELMEYCQQNYALQGFQAQPSDDSGAALVESLTHQHPLTPFSTRAFDGSDIATASYAKEWLPAAKQSDVIAREDNGEVAKLDFLAQTLEPYLAQLELNSHSQYLLELQDLISFWRLPVKYFFNRRLKTYFDNDLFAAAQLDDEPFLVDGLEKYTLGEQLLSDWLNTSQQPNLATFEQQAETFFKQQSAQGQLPLANFGELAVDNLLNSIKPLAQAIQPFIEAPQPDIEVGLHFELNLTGKPQQFHLSGWLKHHYQTGLVRYRNGAIHSANWLGYWVEHLCLNAMGHNQSTQLFGVVKGQVQHLKLIPLDSETAKQYLSQLIALYYQGMDAPLWFIPKTAFVGLQTGYSKEGCWQGFAEKEQKDAAISAMTKTFHDGVGRFGRAMPGEGSNTYIQRVWKEWDNQLAENLLKLSEDLLKPLFDHSKEQQSE